MSLASDLNLLLAAIALLAGSGMTAAVRHFALRVGVLDRPDGRRKLHCDPTPLMGGLALFGSLLATLLIASSLPNSSALLGRLPGGVLPMILVSGGLFCLLGLYDDVRPMRPWHKFICQFIAALPFAIWGQNVAWIEIMGMSVNLGAIFGAALTALWLVACANTINLIDGLDGLAGTVGLIACIGIAVVADIRQFPAVAAIALIVSGSLTGFLCHNLPPARIFLGDSGSLLIGFLIGALSIEASLKTATGFAMTVPLILVSIPAFDTLMAIIRRRLTGRGIGEGDRGHIHHRLQERGLTRTQTLLVISGLCATMTALTVLCVEYRAEGICVLLCGVLLCLLIIGRVFGHHETLLFFRRAQRVGQILFNGSSLFGVRSCRANATWEDVVELVRPFGVSRLELVWCDIPTNRDLEQRDWSDGANDATWELRVSARSTRRRQLSVIAFGNHRRSSATEQAAVFSILDECCRSWAALGALPEEILPMPAEASATVPAGVLPLPSAEPASRRVA